MKYLKYLLTIGLLTCFINADAQYYEEVVYLTNGSVIRGNVLEQTKETIKIEITGGSILVYKMSEVEKIVKEEKKLKFKKKERDYQIKETGYYNAISVGFLPGLGQFGDFAFGGSLHYTFGYQYKPILGAGIGIGGDAYIYDAIQNIIPIYLEGRGYFSNKPFSAYYSVNAGYGFALRSNAWNVTDEKGGIYVHPKIGFRFPSRSNAAFTMELGYSYQRATFTYDDWQGRYEDKISFRRISMRFGVLF
ncbi:MAG: sRNA-binding regulator protein Hfq [Cognaticolwellia sp.]|jgi:sRNA-binding regulator protein Hfq